MPFLFQKSQNIQPSLGTTLFVSQRGARGRWAGKSKESTDSASAGHLFTQKCRPNTHSLPQLCQVLETQMQPRRGPCFKGPCVNIVPQAAILDCKFSKTAVRVDFYFSNIGSLIQSLKTLCEVKGQIHPVLVMTCLFRVLNLSLLIYKTNKQTKAQ